MYSDTVIMFSNLSCLLCFHFEFLYSVAVTSCFQEDESHHCAFKYQIYTGDTIIMDTSSHIGVPVFIPLILVVISIIIKFIRVILVV
jgi:hypothetical protein